MQQSQNLPIIPQGHFSKIWTYLPIFLACGLILISLTSSIALLWFSILLGLLIILSSSAHKYLKIVLISAFAVRVLFIFADSNLGLVPYEWDNYHSHAVVIKQNLTEGLPLFYGVDASVKVKTFAVLLTLLYMLFGNIILVFRITNAFLAIWAIQRIYRICIEVFENHNIAFRVSLFLSFFPSFIIFSSIPMRDALLFFLSADLLYRVIMFSKTKKKAFLVYLIPNLTFVFFLRPQSIPLYFVMLSVYLIFSYSHRRGWSKIAIFSLFIAAIGILFILFDRLAIAKEVLVYINAEVTWRAQGGSAYLVNMDYSSWFDIAKFIPLRFAYFTFGPPPWLVTNTFMLLSFIEALFILTFFILTVKYWTNADRLNIQPQMLLLVFGLIGLAANSIMDSNFGTAIRHRMDYVFVFFIFGCAYLQRFKIKLLR